MVVGVLVGANASDKFDEVGLHRAISSYDVKYISDSVNSAEDAFRDYLKTRQHKDIMFAFDISNALWAKKTLISNIRKTGQECPPIGTPRNICNGSTQMELISSVFPPIARLACLSSFKTNNPKDIEKTCFNPDEDSAWGSKLQAHYENDKIKNFKYNKPKYDYTFYISYPAIDREQDILKLLDTFADKYEKTKDEKYYKAGFGYFKTLYFEVDSLFILKTCLSAVKNNQNNDSILEKCPANNFGYGSINNILKTINKIGTSKENNTKDLEVATTAYLKALIQKIEEPGDYKQWSISLSKAILEKWPNNELAKKCQASLGTEMDPEYLNRNREAIFGSLKAASKSIFFEGDKVVDIRKGVNQFNGSGQSATNDNEDNDLVRSSTDKDSLEDRIKMMSEESFRNIDTNQEGVTK